MLRLPMATKDNKGFFIRPPRQLINRLAQLADQYKKGSANQVAVEIINEYIEFWEEAEKAKKAKREVLDTQRDRLNKLKAQMLGQSPHKP